MMQDKPRELLAFVIAALLLVGAVTAAILWREYEAQKARADSHSSVPIGGPFQLTDEDGRTVTDATYKGKWLLVFFGFTFCPDVCPTTLNDVAMTLDELGPLADKIQPLFISVDPERDTPKALKEYTEAFHPRIVGLTGTPHEIAAVAKAYGVYYRKVPQGDRYSMDHSAIVYVMAPNGRFAAHFSHRAGKDAMASKLRQLLARR